MSHALEWVGVVTLVTMLAWGCSSDSSAPQDSDVADTQTPAPAPDTKTPAPDTKTPALDTEAPAPDAGTPAPDAGTPDADTGPALSCNASLGASEACGGDPTGTWNLEGACADFGYGALARTLCPSATVDTEVVDASGTLVIAGKSRNDRTSVTLALTKGGVTREGKVRVAISRELDRPVKPGRHN